MEEHKMADEDKFAFESFQDKETIKDYLGALVEGIEKGRIILTTNGEEMVLHPDKLLRFSVKVKKKGGSCTLGLKISWKDMKKSHREQSETMSISS
jgi:amphi-Trp domain-containing protein